MKKLFIICVLALIPILNGLSQTMYQDGSSDPSGTLEFICTQNLSAVLASILDEYELCNGEIDLKLDIVESKEDDIQAITGDFLFTSNLSYGNLKPGSWSLTIGRDILVPVVNKENPFYTELLEQGIDPGEFTRLLRSGKNVTWGNLLGIENNKPITLFIDNGDPTITQLQQFTGDELIDVAYLETKKSSEVVEMISRNKFSIGFCRLTDIVAPDRQSFVEGIEVIPIDLNKNGKVDYFESYSKTYSDFTRAVWIGKYPKALFKELKLVSNNTPADKASIAFVEWLLTSGQAQLNTNGYSDLVASERISSLNKVYAYKPELLVDNARYARIGNVFLWILGIVVFFIAAGLLVYFASGKKDSVVNIDRIKGILDASKVVVPGGILFDKSHTWSYMEQNGLVRVGTTDFLQHVTGRISKIIPKDKGESIKRGEPMFTIVQDGKHLVLYSPVSGTIININNNISEKSSIINSSPYTDGWIYEIKPIKWMAEYRNFLLGENYNAWLGKELVRLKEFLGSLVLKNQVPGLKPVLQDGGEIVDNLLEDLGPDMWEEFQIGFIDKAF